eukprot:CAMPEP_0196790434 /NCGR_PEP_ID=MMETSP1104-20130614/28245_1 /TAXON_ID=33652 /ORGANISM="Cafeteria sp., Strain Caron Lab Isolate" /LENGTH=89 /DNA_ID=CAMNT_0042160799 /DNA_START=22 /DNA_END=287 /DNA_ORIENTATION=-
MFLADSEASEVVMEVRGIKILSEDVRSFIFAQILVNMVQTVVTVFGDKNLEYMLFSERFMTKDEALFVLGRRGRAASVIGGLDAAASAG